MGRSRAALLALALAWIAVVAWRYQRVESPEPVALLLLLGLWLSSFTLACLGAGLPVSRLLRGSHPGPHGLPVVAALGAGVLAAAAALLALVGMLRPVPLALVALLFVVLGLLSLRSLPRPSLRLPLGPAIILTAAALLTLLPVATASPFYDALHYHLAFPFQWLRAGTVVTFARHDYSFLPATMGLLYAYPLAPFGIWAAQAVHWWMALLAVAATGAATSLIAGPRAGAWAAALLAATPALLLTATWAAADLGAAGFGAAAWLLVALLGGSPGGRGSWIAVGALTGLAAGSKILALATVAAPIAFAAAALPGRPGQRAGRLALIALGGALTLGPWLLRNAVVAGNPFHPFLGAATDQGVAELGAGVRDPLHLLTLGTFSPRGEAGSLGPAHLALLPLALWAAIAVRRARPLALGALVALLAWGVGPPLGRYLIPSLVPLGILSATGLARLRTIVPTGSRRWLDGLLVALLAWATVAGTSAMELDRAAATLGRSNANRLFAGHASYWPAVARLNRTLPEDAVVLMVGESRSYGIERAVRIEDPFRRPLLLELAASSATPSEIAARLQAEGVTHLLFNEHEADRIARMTGRPEYFSPLSPEQRARLDAFLARCTTPLFSEGPVSIRRMEPCR